MSRLELVLDCSDPERLAMFWSEALGYRVRGSREPYTLLVPGEGDGPPLILQRVPEPKTLKNRMHLDIKAPDVEAEAARLEAIGATRLDVVRGGEEHWIVMADPEGNEFCVCLSGPA